MRIGPGPCETIRREIPERDAQPAAVVYTPPVTSGRTGWIDDALASAEIGIWCYHVPTATLRYRGNVWERWLRDANVPSPVAASLLRAIHPGDLARVRSEIEDYAAGRADLRQAEFRIQAGPDKWRWVQITGDAVQRDAQGRPVLVAGAVHDCTARKAAEKARADAEQQLRQAQKMESLGTFAGGMAHDFNNVLLSIMGFADLAAISLREGLPDVAESIQQIRDAAERGATLSRRLLTFAQKHSATLRRMPVADIVSGIVPMLKRLIPATIALEVSPTAPAVVLADVGQIEQVLVNLVVNARDAIGDKRGKIEIASVVTNLDEAAARRSSVTPGSYVCLSVTDNGVGIDDDLKARIFDPFFTTKPAGKGTGLGLSIVDAIVKQHGGFVTVSGAPGVGARFDVFLPAVQTQAAAPTERQESAPPPGEGELLLLAEDEPAVRKMTVRILTKAGYRVVDAADGDDALAKFAERPEDYHLALLDVLMPGKTGDEVFRDLRKRRPTLPVLFMTGFSGGALRPDLLAEPGVDQITKPFHGPTLLKQIRRLIEG